MKNIIDIRSYMEYSLGHIDKAIWIDKNLLLQRPNQYLNKKDTYYIYCNSGVNSKYVVNQLNRLGYNTINIDGGYQNNKNI